MGDERIETIMTTKDPRKLYQQPPYSVTEQPPPGSEEEMSPRVDHGEADPFADESGRRHYQYRFDPVL